ncbi:MAG: hypothetical protein OJF49_002572 [Ktedonobacterales bacterium]|nr:MAG: hypothetical protein OJF49_002572 [Ktedonobacterales bacterium]
MVARETPTYIHSVSHATNAVRSSLSQYTLAAQPRVAHTPRPYMAGAQA